MYCSDKIYLKDAFLRCLLPDDASNNYLDWFSDKHVVKFLNVRKSLPQSVDKLAGFIKECIDDPHVILFGIFDKKKKEHIGNIKIRNLKINDSCEFGYLIGNSRFWGKGIMSEAIHKLANYVKKEFDCKSVISGVHRDNYSSIKLMEKNSFIITHIETLSHQFPDISKEMNWYKKNLSQKLI